MVALLFFGLLVEHIKAEQVKSNSTEENPTQTQQTEPDLVDGTLLIKVFRDRNGIVWRFFDAGWSQDLDAKTACELIANTYRNELVKRKLYVECDDGMSVKELVDVAKALVKCGFTEFTLNGVMSCKYDLNPKEKPK